MCAMYSFENSVVEAPNNNLSAKLGLAAARFHYGGSKATEVFTNGMLKGLPPGGTKIYSCGFNALKLAWYTI